MNGSSETAQSEAVKKLNEHRLFVMPLEVERARAWLEVLGSHALPVTSREPVVATEGPFKGKRFYMMAYPELLTSVDKDRLMAYVERTARATRS